MEHIKAIDIGKFFYDKNNEFTAKQIQKLTYYAYVWYMIKYNKSLLEEKPQAWIHGPVFASLYGSMRSGKFFHHEKCEFDNNITELLNIVYKVYGKYTGNQLEHMTHLEDPWKKARVGLEKYDISKQEIKDEDIIAYYSV